MGNWIEMGNWIKHDLNTGKPTWLPDSWIVEAKTIRLGPKESDGSHTDQYRYPSGPSFSLPWADITEFKIANGKAIEQLEEEKNKYFNTLKDLRDRLTTDRNFVREEGVEIIDSVLSDDYIDEGEKDE